MDEPPCGTAIALDLLGGRWRTLILAHLKQGPLHHAALRSHIPGISQKMLTQRLRELERDGLVSRTPEGGRVVYALSAQARRLEPALQALYDLGCAWAEAHGLPVRTPVT